jgi:queuosine precursor transporter
MKQLSKENRLLVVLACVFVGNTLIAEVIGPKMFSLEKSFGFTPVNWTLFGIENLSFNFSAGSILWPLVFIMTDVVNEYYGKRGVRFLSFIAAGVISYAFLMLFITTKAAPADFWLVINEDIKPDINIAFNRIFGTGMWIIIGSLTAFLVSQLLDAYFFQQFKKATGNRLVWLRATGSTVISQLFDSFIILIIVFYIGADPAHRWSWSQIAAIGLMGYFYKVLTAIVLTPMLYFVHTLITNYLGAETAERLKKSAINLD